MYHLLSCTSMSSYLEVTVAHNVADCDNMVFMRTVPKSESFSFLSFSPSLYPSLSDCPGSDPALLPLGNQCLDRSDRHRRVGSRAVLCGHKAVPDTEEHSGECEDPTPVNVDHLFTFTLWIWKIGNLFFL